MKKYMYIVMALALVILWALPASAIDKSKKDAPAPKQKQPAVDKKVKNNTRTVTDSKKTVTSTPRKKNYDDFVDRNNNGIDDRAEKGSKSTSSKKPDSSRQKKAPDKPKP